MDIDSRRRILRVYSYPRSGTNWLLALLSQAFYGRVSLVETVTGHWSERVPIIAPDRLLRGGHISYRQAFRGPYVYLFRDGRDVALSLWRTKIFQHASWHDMSFAEFLQRPLDWHESPREQAKDVTRTVAEHWMRHLESWQDVPHACFVRYEDLLLHTESEVARIAAFVGRRPLPAGDDIKGIGPSPSGDYRTQKWKDVFTQEDLDYFFSIVPEDFWGLWKGNGHE